MVQDKLLAKREKALRVLAGLALALLVFQVTGALMYVVTAWPKLPAPPSTAVAIVGAAAMLAGLARSFVWVAIYWSGGRAIGALRAPGEPGELPERLSPILGRVTRLLVLSCALDFLLLPMIFLMDAFFPFQMSSVQLGMVQLAVLLIPEAFGLTALALAWLVHQYGRLVRERAQMRRELELTI